MSSGSLFGSWTALFIVGGVWLSLGVALIKLEQYANTMDIDDIASLPVSSIMADDSYLFMWATWPTMWENAERNAFRVMERWGFRYVTLGLLWVKTNPSSPRYAQSARFGQGFHTKCNSEPCLLGVRGRPWAKNGKTDKISQVCSAPGDNPPHEIWAPVTRHSEKPDEARRTIIEFCGDLPRVELFARHERHGFVAWGNELPVAVQGEFL